MLTTQLLMPATPELCIIWRGCPVVFQSVKLCAFIQGVECIRKISRVHSWSKLSVRPSDVEPAGAVVRAFKESSLSLRHCAISSNSRVVCLCHFITGGSPCSSDLRVEPSPVLMFQMRGQLIDNARIGPLQDFVHGASKHERLTHAAASQRQPCWSLWPQLTGTKCQNEPRLALELYIQHTRGGTRTSGLHGCQHEHAKRHSRHLRCLWPHAADDR
jgi:hypothetical protein